MQKKTAGTLKGREEYDNLSCPAGGNSESDECNIRFHKNQYVKIQLRNTKSPLILYNTEYKSGGVQKLRGAVFCTRPAAEKLTVLYQINGELI